MTQMTAQPKQPDFGFVFSIGPAVDLAQLKKVMADFGDSPWLPKHEDRLPCITPTGNPEP